MDKNLLLVVDDSENARKAVELVARSFTREHKITLFSTIQDTSAICAMNSPTLPPLFKARQMVFCVLEEKRRRAIREALKAAREYLVDAGFKEENIRIKAQTRKWWMSKAILAEARSGYSTVVVGRGCVWRASLLTLGSSTLKVLRCTRGISVALAG